MFKNFHLIRTPQETECTDSHKKSSIQVWLQSWQENLTYTSYGKYPETLYTCIKYHHHQNLASILFDHDTGH